MDWYSQTTKYLESDLAQFNFVPGVSFRIRTVTLTANNGSPDFQPKDFDSEREFVKWVEECESSLQDRPTFILVIHERHKGATDSIPYSEEAFSKVSEKLFQHRSLTLSMPRTSTAIFNSRPAEWMCNGDVEKSIVYNCKSDTEILGFKDDVLLSTTYFKTKPWTFSVMYGCTSESSDELVGRIKRFKKSAFHPLMMPIVFAEHERARFMNAMELKSTMLKDSMLDLKNSLDREQERKSKDDDETAKIKNRKMTEKDLQSTDSWIGVSNMKIGLESFRNMLMEVKEQFKTFGDLKPRLDTKSTGETIVDSMTSEIIKGRLKEMDAEIDTKIRQCDGLLNGMALAIQVEWNHYTRRDAKANIIIARLSHQDSTQMKLMSLVGMIFLPGTFLATLFSMSFFRWIPDDSPQMVSPYVAVYFGLTAVITGMTIFFWRWQNSRRKIDPELAEVLYDVIDQNDLEKGQRIITLSKGKHSQHSSVSSRGSGGTELDIMTKK